MAMVRKCAIFWISTCLAVGLCTSFKTIAAEQETFDTLYPQLESNFESSPQTADAIFEKLKALQSTFTQDQREKYQLAYASSLGFKGKHEERIASVESFIGQVKKPARRARFLYELIAGNTALGRHEKALNAMNESILLLPAIENTSQKVVVLQGAASLLESLHAYEDALALAERIYALRESTVASLAACVGLADRVELNFKREDRGTARLLVPEAVKACEASNNQVISLIAKALAVIDSIDSGQYTKGVGAGLPLLEELSQLSQGSDYVPQLQEALARAYLKTGNLERAEHFGLRAYERAQAGRVLLLQEKTSETMAAIKRAQGHLAAAIGYYDINLEFKKKVLDDQVQKNLAYQRVKFDTQDKANQLALLEQKNQNLRMEKTLHERQYENLILLITLGLVLLAAMGAWLLRTLGKMDSFRHSAQVDALTQVSNRAYFTACAQQAFKDSRQTVSLVLFDMDYFKQVNDTFGHATGDWVLKTVCDTVKSHLRKTDLFGRLGGEEFALCLSEFSPEEVLTLAERCRVAILAIDTKPSGFAFAIASSFGIATRAIGETDSFKDLLAAADKALYVSKNTGRNRVTVYQPSAADTHPTPA
ncbi:MAG: diguanylate cyclase [Burkholderiales bacterium]|nr:diguanylate cyclase [Burkholderiales bacterium]